MAVLFNFPEINEKSTAKNVLNFFNDDVDKLIRVAGHSLATTSQLRTTGEVGTNNLNGMEHRMLNAHDARRELDLIADAINELPMESRKLLTYKYINNWSDTKILIELHIGRATLQRHLVKARVDFAYQYATKGRNLLIEK